MNEEHGSEYRAQVGLSFGDWLSGYAVFLVKWNIYRDSKVT